MSAQLVSLMQSAISVALIVSRFFSSRSPS